jgi:protein-S-isoprenylcysteine O-methyltransferase Ste14
MNRLNSVVVQSLAVIGAVAIGLLGVVGSFAWLGILRSIGQEWNQLRTTGVYRLTRNPQLVAGTFIVIGYTILRPTWYAVGWIMLYVILTHLMVMAEEEHLSRVFGKDYDCYCAGTPRYVGLHKPGKE